jgi:hypothetical protein
MGATMLSGSGFRDSENWPDVLQNLWLRGEDLNLRPPSYECRGLPLRLEDASAPLPELVVEQKDAARVFREN